MTTEELKAGPAAEETAAIALPVPEADEDDLEDDEGEDAAAVADRWRRDAREARERSAQLAAEAEDRKRRIDAETGQERQRLEAEAAEAEGQAAHWQAIADRDALIAAGEREAGALSGRLSALRAEEAALTAEADQLAARLAEFGAAREEARQRLRGAPSIADVSESIAAVKDANDTLVAIGAAEAPPLERLGLVQGRLAEIRGHEELRDLSGGWRGPATGMAGLQQDLARLQERLRVLRREASGLPPEGEAAVIAMRITAQMDPPEDLAPEAVGMWRVMAIAPVARHLEETAVASPEEYALIRDRFLRGPEREPERAPTAREVLGLGPQQQPVPVRLPDGGWSVGWRVPELPALPGAR